MKKYNLDDLNDSIQKLKIRKGSNIFVNPEFFKFGYFDGHMNNREKFYSTILNSLTDQIGKNGTILVNSYTFDVARFNKTFIYEKSKSTSGSFGEYIRNLKNSIRSTHPIFSLTALGKNAKYLCENNSIHNYGSGSPYERLLKLNGYVLNFGLEPHNNPFYHVAEFLNGSPLYYNKVFNVSYKKKNLIKKKIFISYVRYLDLDINNWKIDKLNFFKKELLKKKIVKVQKLGLSKIYYFKAEDFLIECQKYLQQDPFFFIKKPKFNINRPPFK